MAKLEADWDVISTSLHLAVGLLSDFGLSGGTLTADSVLIPVAYYVHHRKLGHSYRQSPNTRQHREALRSWVLRSLIVRGVWGSGLDTLLRELRELIRKHGRSSFPTAAVEHAMALRGKSLAVTNALVEDVLGLEYGKARTFAVLATLFPHVDTRNLFHVDLVFPAAMLGRKVLAGQKAADGSPLFTAEEIAALVSQRDQLPNLELLPGLENIGKSDKVPDEWPAAEYPSPDDRSAFLARNALPAVLPHSVDEFRAFFQQRRHNLVSRIREKLKTQHGEPDMLPPTPPGADLDEEISEGDFED